MIDSLAAAVTIASLFTALAVLGVALTGRYRWRGIRSVLVGAEVVIVLQAVIAVVSLARGHRPGEPAVFLAYLAVSVVLLPAMAVLVRRDDDRWSGVLVSVGFVVLAVVVVRASATWRS